MDKMMVKVYLGYSISPVTERCGPLGSGERAGYQEIG